MEYDSWNASKRIVWCLHCHYQNKIPNVTSIYTYYCENCGEVLC